MLQSPWNIGLPGAEGDFCDLYIGMQASVGDSWQQGLGSA